MSSYLTLIFALLIPLTPQLSFALPDFNGAASVNGCSGALVKLDGTRINSRALVLTNGHCIHLKTSARANDTFHPDETIVNRNFEEALAFPDIRLHDGIHAGIEVTARRLLFATMSRTDVAVIQLNASYSEIETSFGILPFKLGNDDVKISAPLFVHSGLFNRTQSCSLDSRVTLHEGPFETTEALKLTGGCTLYPGFSGSPLVSTDGRTVVGLANTHYDSESPGRPCDFNKPCEIHPDDSHITTPLDGQSYGVQTRFIYDCINQDSGELDFSSVDCLPHGRLRGTRQTWAYGGQQVAAEEPLSRTLVAIGNSKSQVCSGTFVAKDVVLTAAHCVLPDEDGNAIGQVGDSVYPLSLREGYDPIRGEKLKIISVSVFPDKQKSDIWLPIGENNFPFDNPDFALLKLERPYSLALPAVFAEVDSTNSAEAASFAGFGQGGTQWQRPDRIEFAKLKNTASDIRAAYAEISSGNTFEFVNALIANFDKVRPYFYFVKTLDPSTQGLCYGDSGGPLFITRSGRIEILAVASLYIPHPDKGNAACSGSYLSVFAKVSPHREWLVNEARRLAELR